VQRVSATRGTPDLNLSAFEFSLTNAANPLIIERIPFSQSVSRTQDRQSIVKFDVSNHSVNSTRSLRRNKQSGRWMIG
jgi:hypothetical protein